GGRGARPEPPVARQGHRTNLPGFSRAVQSPLSRPGRTACAKQEAACASTADGIQPIAAAALYRPPRAGGQRQLYSALAGQGCRLDRSRQGAPCLSAYAGQPPSAGTGAELPCPVDGAPAGTAATAGPLSGAAAFAAGRLTRFLDAIFSDWLAEILEVRLAFYNAMTAIRR